MVGGGFADNPPKMGVLILQVLALPGIARR